MNNEYIIEFDNKYRDFDVTELKEAIIGLKVKIGENQEILQSINAQLMIHQRNEENNDWFINAINKKKYIQKEINLIQIEITYLKEKLKPNKKLRCSKQYLVLGYQYAKMKEFIIKKHGNEVLGKICNFNNKELYNFFAEITKINGENK
jgi:hypothetical protein